MDLRTSELDRQDLPAALTDSARRWVANSSVAVEVNIDNVRGPLPENLEQNIFRIAQEAVINAVKHSGARLVRIDLSSEERSLWLRIKDDGLGFETPAAFSVFGGHFGILGMRERVERLSGEFVLSSQPGAGTQVEVRIPFEPHSIKFSKQRAG
jgi:signal transduction histidine kinase